MNDKSDRAPSYTKTVGAASLLVIAYIGSPVTAYAEEYSAGRALARISDRMTLLEQAFWHCDYAATTHGIDATPMEACSAVYADLKHEKFHGSFENLLRWWTENKANQHLNIQRTVEERY